MKLFLLFFLMFLSIGLRAQDTEAYPKFDIYKYFADNFKYPDEARNCHIEGSVSVGFTVNEDGSVSDCKIVPTTFGPSLKASGSIINEDGTETVCKLTQAIIDICNKEAISLVSSMPQWHPQVTNGKAQKLNMTLPVNFQLPKSNEPFKYHFYQNIFSSVTTMPQAGYDLEKYFKEHVHYPDAAKAKNVQGRVTYYCSIDEDGGATECRLIRGIGEGCDEEALRLISNMPHWTPGKQGNLLPLRVYSYLSVTFQL